jgi:hypothetical protein
LLSLPSSPVVFSTLKTQMALSSLVATAIQFGFSDELLLEELAPPKCGLMQMKLTVAGTGVGGGGRGLRRSPLTRSRPTSISTEASESGAGEVVGSRRRLLLGGEEASVLSVVLTIDISDGVSCHVTAPDAVSSRKRRDPDEAMMVEPDPGR